MIEELIPEKINSVLNEDQLLLLDLYYSVSKKWNDKINITGNTDVGRYVLENILDPICSLLALTDGGVIDLNSDLRVLDVGCGGGYVGMSWQILNPSLHVTFLDSDRKKINFCKQVMRVLNIQDQNFVCERMEQYVPDSKFDIIVSRATWSYSEYIKRAEKKLRSGGVIVSYEGALWNQDLVYGNESVLEYKIGIDEIVRYLVVAKPF